MLKIGIMGGASIVPRVVEGIKVSGKAEVIALARRDLSSAQKMAQELSIPKAYDSYEKLVADEELDLIYIPLVNSLHFSGAKMALEAGKHVLLEKPFTMTTEEAEELFDLAASKNLFIMEAQKDVFLPITLEVKQALSDGIIGDLQFIENKESRAGDRQPWAKKIENGGGTFLDIASYPLSYLQILLGIGFNEYKGLFTSDGESPVDLENEIILRKANILINNFISTKMKFDNEIVFHGTKGEIHVANYWRAEEAHILLNDGTEKIFSHPHQTEFAYEIQHVANCIEKGLLTSPIMSRQMTLSNVKIVQDIYRDWYGEEWPNL